VLEKVAVTNMTLKVIEGYNVILIDWPLCILLFSSNCMSVFLLFSAH